MTGSPRRGSAKIRRSTPVLSTSELLDGAYAVVEGGDCEDQDLWWEILWPYVKRLEACLRAGKRRGDPDDERELERLTRIFSVLRR